MLCTQPYDVAVSGSYAYVAASQSDSLVVVDVSNSASPVIRGRVVSSSLLDHAYGVAVSGSFAYVAAVYSESVMVAPVEEVVKE